MVSLTKSLEITKEMRENGTINGIKIETIKNTSEVSKRPSTSADYSNISVVPLKDTITSTSYHDLSNEIESTSNNNIIPKLPIKTYKTSPKKLIRTDIGYIDTTSTYAKYKIGDVNKNITLQEMNKKNYENDDGYDE